MTIAGSDSGGGAGIQTDLKTFQELGVFGTSSNNGIDSSKHVRCGEYSSGTGGFCRATNDGSISRYASEGIKTGMLFSAEIIQAVSQLLAEKDVQLVIDPVMIAKGGATLLQQNAINALKKHLLPIATVITPNVPEAAVLSGVPISSEADVEKAAKVLLQSGVKCVVMKGGHLSGDKAIDTIYFADGTTFMMESERIQTTQTHGTGCTFSAALTAFLAKGLEMKEAIVEAKKFVQLAISYPLNIGKGHGPTNHFAYNQFKDKVEVTLIES